MQCPVCQHLRYRRDWTPQQWIRETPDTWPVNGHDRCKVCSGGVQTVRNSRADLPPQPADSQAVRQDADKQLCVFVWLLHNFEYTRFTTFIQRWMELPRFVRKDLSYDGAIQCRGKSGERSDYVCSQLKLRYFDPGNHIYAGVLDLLCPSLCSWYNQETKGDILESLLGYHYTLVCSRKTGVIIDPSHTWIIVVVRDVCWIIHAFVYMMVDMSMRGPQYEGLLLELMQRNNVVLPKLQQYSLEKFKRDCRSVHEFQYVTKSKRLPLA